MHVRTLCVRKMENKSLWFPSKKPSESQELHVPQASPKLGILAHLLNSSQPLSWFLQPSAHWWEHAEDSKWKLPVSDVVRCGPAGTSRLWPRGCMIIAGCLCSGRGDCQGPELAIAAGKLGKPNGDASFLRGPPGWIPTLHIRPLPPSIRSLQGILWGSCATRGL